MAKPKLIKATATPNNGYERIEGVFDDGHTEVILSHARPGHLWAAQHESYTAITVHRDRAERLGNPIAVVPIEREADRLFIGKFATGISYADRTIEENGDYQRIAFLPYSTLELEIRRPASPLLPLIREDAAKMQARRGEEFQVSAAGQTVVLGSK